ILDGSQNTYYVASPKDTTATINLTFSKPVEFDVLLLQENIALGQRVEKFVLAYKDGDDWKTITQGTTIGYKRLLRFKTISAKEVRLNILSSRLNPTITELGLYKSK
ncbi:MAG: alpha-L-fucosidase, partial [Pedobacter sp.]